MDIDLLIKKVVGHAESIGRTPESVCRAATGQPRLFDRLTRRAAQTQKDAHAINNHIDAEVKAAAAAAADIITEAITQGDHE